MKWVYIVSGAAVLTLVVCFVGWVVARMNDSPALFELFGRIMLWDLAVIGVVWGGFFAYSAVVNLLARLAGPDGKSE